MRRHGRDVHRELVPRATKGLGINLPVLVPVSIPGSATDRNCALASDDALDDAEQVEMRSDHTLRQLYPLDTPGANAVGQHQEFATTVT